FQFAEILSMAASSSSFCGVDPSPCKYDVFISFRAGDPRHNFIGHLYSALCRNQVKTYIDEISLQKGDDISRALPKAIEESAISIIIFSANYASSTWCLDELLHILECKREKSHTVLPIFLGVNPSDIRKQKRSYGDAFVKHEQHFNSKMDKVLEWRQALIEASGLAGWDSQVKSESVIIDEVVEHIEKLKHIGSNGLIQDLLKNLKEELRLVNRALEDAEEKQLTDEYVREWLLNMKEVNCRADKLTDKINHEELRHKRRKLRFFFFFLTKLYFHIFLKVIIFIFYFFSGKYFFIFKTIYLSL
ncbi:hypothetical protein UlMin_039892, partial [Ulmus minor]